MDKNFNLKKIEQKLKDELLNNENLSDNENELLKKISASMKLKLPNIKTHKGGSIKRKKSKKNNKRKTTKRTKRR